MKLNNIKWIFFDMGSTLIDETLAMEHRIREVIEGTDVTYKQFIEKKICFAKQNKPADLETIKFFGLTKTPWHKADERLYPDTIECLEKLYGQYKIGIIANQSPGSQERLEAFGILKYIDLVVASAEEGVAKPDKRIFEIALERAGCKSDEVAMVGDRLDNDIVPANEIGMYTIWIKQGNWKDACPMEELEQPDMTVESLSELYEKIGMKTLIFMGSPRKHGDTMSLVNLLCEDLQGEVKIVYAYDCHFSGCLDCRYCWKNEGCALDDGMQEIYDYIQECDNILIASPVYFSQLSGKLLDVASRLQTYFCGRFFRKTEPVPKKKKGAVILVGGGDGHLENAYDVASTLLHHMNSYDIHPLVYTHMTNERSALEDENAVNGVKEIVGFFNG